MNSKQIKSVVAQVLAQHSRGEVDDDLVLFVTHHEDVFEEEFPRDVWADLESREYSLRVPEFLENGMSSTGLRKQMWKSKAFHRHMCGS